jgi:hypothetical protein
MVLILPPVNSIRNRIVCCRQAPEEASDDEGEGEEIPKLTWKEKVMALPRNVKNSFCEKFCDTRG